MEVSPAAAALAYELGNRVGQHGGAGLIIDYGANHAASSSLRGIRDHKFVDPLLDPGQVDLSVDVDFAAAAHAVQSTGVAKVRPVPREWATGFAPRLQRVHVCFRVGRRTAP